MKLQFESNQEYPLEAIGSVVDIFEGQPLSTGEYEFSLVTFNEPTSLEDIQKSV